MQQFVHLNCHSEYSIVDGMLRIDEFIDALAESNMPACALTDKMNIFAAVKFYQAAIAKGIKPIIGADINLFHPQDPAHPWEMIVLCQNETGYQHIKELIAKAYLENQQCGKAQIKREWLYEKNEGLILLSGAGEGEIGRLILDNKLQAAADLINEWQRYFHNRFYLECRSIQAPQEQQLIQETCRLAEKCAVPVVITNAVRFLKADDFMAHEARVCIHEGRTLSDTARERVTTKQQYLKSAAEMHVLFPSLSLGLENSVEIAKRCNLRFSLGKNYLPTFPVPNGETIDSFLRKHSHDGLNSRFMHWPSTAENELKKQTYSERLDLELNVIISMGFAGYFLIVADFIAWGRSHDVPVGPGRGSGAGSLVAYALGITDIDPLQYALLFERFLNPERVSMPDFDIDFCMIGRDRVIDYVAEKYGRSSVSQIITFGTMAAKAVIRDVGRVFGHPYGFVDKIAKLIPFELGITLDKALEQEPELRSRYESEEEVRSLIDLAKKLEGITRNAGKHAGGVVIAPSALTDFTSLYCEPDGSNLVSQFDKDDVEAVGLVKFDFLGLRTLTIIDRTLKIVNAKKQMQGEALIDISLIPLDDAETFDLLKACNTTAVFQLESRGMKDLIKRLQPDCFEEIIALVALFRPGPLQSGMVDDFIHRKHGLARVEYLHEKLEDILNPTYGVILYQEQVMQIAQVLAGYTLGSADLLRRAMGKKKPEEMAKQRDIFLKGAVQNGVKDEIATQIFDLMEKFAGYGFNKSHSAAYALVSYQTAWLKTHYLAAFMAAVLSSDMDNTDKVVNFIEDCKQQGLKVLPPHVNHSQYYFTVIDEKTILYGLGAIKGVGENAIEIICQEQAKQPFADIYDFCARMDLRKINRRVLEALIYSGALDDMGTHRAAMLASLDNILKWADQQKSNNIFGQADLFSQEECKPSDRQYANVPVFNDSKRLQGEKETLGHYLSGHPIDGYRAELRHFVSGSLSQLQTGYENVTVAGLCLSVRKLMTKKGKPMAILTIADEAATLDVTIFSELYETAIEKCQKGNLIVVQGNVSFDEFSNGLRITASEVWTIEMARERFANALVISLKQEITQPALIAQLKSLLQSHQPGKCSLRLAYSQSDAALELECGSRWQVFPSDELLQSLIFCFGEDNVNMDYSS